MDRLTNGWLPLQTIVIPPGPMVVHCPKNYTIGRWSCLKRGYIFSDTETRRVSLQDDLLSRPGWLDNGLRSVIMIITDLKCLNDDNEMMSTQVVRKQDNLKMEGDFERPPVSAWQVWHSTCGSRLCLCFSKCICICVFVCVHLCLCEQQIDKQSFLERGAIGSCAQRG